MSKCVFILNGFMNEKRFNEIIAVTYVLNGKNDTGPIKQNAIAINVLPIKADSFGCMNLSTIHPQTGAVTA